MKRYDILILTDHTNHSSENSVYAFVNALKNNKRFEKIVIATRGISKNDDFFNRLDSDCVWATEVKGDFLYTNDGSFFKENLKQVCVSSFDIVWLRLPPPLSESFLDFLAYEFNDSLIINSPSAIYETGSKEFLMNFKEFCAPMEVCKSVDDIIDLKKRFPIVLKPFRAYGGKGIVRIDGEKVWSGNKRITFNKFVDSLDQKRIEYLGVKFLENVKQGDKRIIVVNGKILGASLRLPAYNSWLCNVSMGGSSNRVGIEAEEYNIIEGINPVLSKRGIVMYGVDTLVGDDGKRVLSEINTTSIGGLPQIANMVKLPLVEEAIDLICDYAEKNKKYDK